MFTAKDRFKNFFTLGISHWKAPLHIREQFSLSLDQTKQLITRAKDEGFEGAFMVSTCNRTQIFAVGEHPEKIQRLLSDVAGAEYSLMKEYGFILRQRQAVEHLFELTVGIDSMILGDVQIASQIKQGFQLSDTLQMASPFLKRVMQYVLQAYKIVMTDTNLAQGAASVAHAGVQWLKHQTPAFENKHLMLYGLGEIGVVTLKNLVENYRFRSITIVNRSSEKAEMLSKKLGISFAFEENLSEHAMKADIIVVATGAQKSTLTKEHLGDSHKKILLDLAVPRNIDSAIDIEHNVGTVDDLHEIQDSTLEERKRNIPKARTILNIYQMEFFDWLKIQELSPVIHALKQSAEEMRTEEMQKHQHRWSDEEKEKIDVFSKSVINKLINRNIEYLKKSHRNDAEISQFIQEMYQLHIK